MTKCLKVIYKKEENNMNTEITKEKKYTIEQLGTKLEKLESKIKTDINMKLIPTTTLIASFDILIFFFSIIN